jgi:uncharacterized protein YaiL (DUF2058 family)
MQNLRDKLLKAGLVSKDQVQRADAQPPPPAQQRARPENTARASARPPPAARRPEPREVSVPKLPPLPGSKAHQRIEAQKQREIDNKLRELVQPNQVAIEPGTHTFYFVTRKGKLRRLELSDAQAALLEQGKLAVVERQEPACIEHSLVPPEVAEKMMAIFPKAVRFLNREGAAVGFISDDELKERQAAEAAEAAQEASSEQAPPEQAPSEPEKPSQDEKSGGMWIAVKRAPRT